MNLNERPYQVALGGSGEATAHPEFTAALQAFRELDIIPNYTTNGMHLSDPVLDATIEYCGGVAVSCHPHLERHWRDAIRKLCQLKIKLNLHVVVSDRESIQQLTALFQSSIEIGGLMEEIKKRELFLPLYPTFKEYLTSRWGVVLNKSQKW